MTTLSCHDTYTAHRSLTENVAPDGGRYIPFSLPAIDQKRLRDFISLGCCETVAQILNLFFPARLNAWDVQVSIGRNPIRIRNHGRKILLAETWGNPGGSYEYAVSSLNDRLLGASGAPVCSWTRIAIGIAMVFGIYTQMHQTESVEFSTSFDICVPDADLSQLLSALYARKMGLPINRIILCSKDNGTFWEFVNHGQLNTSQIPPDKRLDMQCLLSCLFGQESVADYVAACDRKDTFCILPDQLAIMNGCLFSAVIGDGRVDAVTENVGISFAPDAAICYAGLQDYRSKTGQGRQTVLIGYTAPN